MSKVPVVRWAFHEFGGSGVTSVHALAKARLRSIVTPAASRVVAAKRTSLVERALREAGRRRSALAWQRRPLSALAVRKAGRVCVLVNAPLLVLTPNAILLRAICAAGERRARRRAGQCLVARAIPQEHAFIMFHAPKAHRVGHARLAIVQLPAEGLALLGTLVEHSQWRERDLRSLFEPRRIGTLFEHARPASNSRIVAKSTVGRGGHARMTRGLIDTVLLSGDVLLCHFHSPTLSALLDVLVAPLEQQVLLNLAGCLALPPPGGPKRT